MTSFNLLVAITWNVFNLYFALNLLLYVQKTTLIKFHLIDMIFLADFSIVQDELQIGTPSSPHHCLDVDISKSVDCVHTSTSTKRVNCGTPTADARSTMSTT